jgi:integrase
MSQLCDINDPEQVRIKLAELEWKNTSKEDVAQKYDGFLKFYGATWNKPHYKRESIVYFIPTEKELDTLISAGSPKTATTMQFLKETGARIGEAMQTKWTDIDHDKHTVYIHAEKGSNDRILPISDKLLAMLNQMKHINNNVFQPTKSGFRGSYTSLRNRTAKKLNQPRLRKVTLHTFRHWKATTEYHKTRDIYYVKTILGHKSLQSTDVYINVEASYYLKDSDEWICKIASTVKEDAELIETGFEYVTERDGLKLFKKRK